MIINPNKLDPKILANNDRKNSEEVLVKYLAIQSISDLYGHPVRAVINERTCSVLTPEYYTCRPDLILVIDGDVVIVEVKTYKDIINPQQFINYTILGNFLYLAYCGNGSNVSKMLDSVPSDVGLIEVNTLTNTYDLIRHAQRHDIQKESIRNNLYHFIIKKLPNYDKIPYDLLVRIYIINLYYYAKVFSKSIDSKLSHAKYKDAMTTYSKLNTKFFKRVKRFCR